MTHVRIEAICKRVRKNNGIVEVLFTRQSNFADNKSQEAHVLINVPAELGPFECGKNYWIEIYSGNPLALPRVLCDGPNGPQSNIEEKTNVRISGQDRYRSA